MAGIAPDLKRRIEEHLARQQMELYKSNPMIGWPPDPGDLSKITLGSMVPNRPQIMPAVGRRFKISPYTDSLAQLGRPMHLPALTLHTDVVRRMRERIGLDRFINQQFGAMYGSHERRR